MIFGNYIEGHLFDILISDDNFFENVIIPVPVAIIRKAENTTEEAKYFLQNYLEFDTNLINNDEKEATNRHTAKIGFISSFGFCLLGNLH